MKTRILTLTFLFIYSFSFCQVEKLLSSDQLLFGPQNVDRILSSQKAHYIATYSLMVEELYDEIAELDSEISVIAVNSARENKTKKRKSKSIGRLAQDLAVLEYYIELWASSPTSVSEKIAEFHQEYHTNACYQLNTPMGVLEPEEFKFVEHTSSTNYHEIIPISHVTKKGEWVRRKKSPNCFSQNPDDCYVACYEVKEVIGINIKQGRLTSNFEGCPEGFKMSKGKTHCARNVELELDDTNEEIGLSLINLKKGTAILDIEDWTKKPCD